MGKVGLLRFYQIKYITVSWFSAVQESLFLFLVTMLPAGDGHFGGGDAAVRLLHPAFLVEAVVGVVVAAAADQTLLVAFDRICHPLF